MWLYRGWEHSIMQLNELTTFQLCNEQIIHDEPSINVTTWPDPAICTTLPEIKIKALVNLTHVRPKRGKMLEVRLI